MALAGGGSLSGTVFRVGTIANLINLVSFNDIRSAHTAFIPSVTWTDVACQ